MLNRLEPNFRLLYVREGVHRPQVSTLSMQKLGWMRQEVAPLQRQHDPSSSNLVHDASLHLSGSRMVW